MRATRLMVGAIVMAALCRLALAEAPEADNLIVPGKSIYGVPYGTTEDDFIKTVGEPDVYVRFKDKTSELMYGKTHRFLFTDKKLSGISIKAHSFVDVLKWQSVGNTPENELFDNRKWHLDNGVTRDMTVAEMKTILGDKLEKGGTRRVASNNPDVATYISTSGLHYKVGNTRVSFETGTVTTFQSGDFQTQSATMSNIRTTTTTLRMNATGANTPNAVTKISDTHGGEKVTGIRIEIEDE